MRKITITSLLSLALCFAYLSIAAQFDSTLYKAVIANDLPTVQELVAEGADLNAVDTSNQSSYLMWAVYKAELPLVQYLVKQGIPLDTIGCIRYSKRERPYGSLLGIAAGEGKLDQIKYFLDSLNLPLEDREYNPKSKQKDGFTPLQRSSDVGERAVVDYLIERGADTEAACVELGKYYQYFKEYFNAEPLLICAKERAQLAYLADTTRVPSFYYGLSLHNLAGLYRNMGYYEKALPIYLEALNLWQKTFGENHRNCMFTMDRLSILYELMGNYPKALAGFTQATSIIKNKFGNQHRDYAICINSLAKFYLNTQNYEAALPRFKESLAIFRSMYEQEQQALNYHRVQMNLADTYRKTGVHEEARQNYEEALDFFKNKYGVEHQDYANCLEGLASYYCSIGDFSKGLMLQDSVLIIKEKLLGNNHPNLRNNRLLMATLEEQSGQLNASKVLYQQAITSANNQIHQQLEHFSEREQQLLITTLANTYNAYHSFNYRHEGEQSTLFNSDLIRKGLLLGNKRQLLAKLATHENDTLQNNYQNWQRVNKVLSTQWSLPTSKRAENFTELVALADNLESELARQSVQFKTARQKITWLEVQAQLQENEAVVEFVNFNYHHENRATDSTLYAAYILRKKDTIPQYVYLFEEQAMLQLIGADKDRRMDYVDRLYGTAGRGVKPVGEAMPTLYDLIWQPLDSLLTDVEKVYYAPSGLLHRIAFHAIPVTDEMVLSDKYKLYALGSSRQLVEKEPSTFALTDTLNQALVFGGIQYNWDSTAIFTSIANYDLLDSMSQLSLASRSNPGASDWRYLKYTQQEADNVSNILTKANIATTVYQGYEATEEAFKYIGQKSPSPTILHIATHGYFFPDELTKQDSTDLGYTTFRYSEHPMIRSGLIMAGANRTWMGQQTTGNLEDGILTAYEISQMNLANTDLVVLSACETGLGDISGNEGVYGLQRAFKIAGAKYVLMSLWQVKDRPSQELMTHFYKNLLAGTEIHQAFKQAQQFMKDKYEDPYYWAGFVLVE